MAGIRIGGLSSGMDTQSIVDQLMTLETKKIENYQDKKLDLEIDVAAWSEVSGYMTNLMDSLYTLRSSDTWNKMDPTASDSSKLTATASNVAAEAIYTVEVSQLARSHSVSSSKATDIGLTDTDTLLVGNVAGIATGDTFQLGTGGNAQTIDIEATDTLSTLVTKINTASASVDETDKVFAFILDTGSNAKLVITRQDTGSTEISLSEPDDPAETPLQDLGIFSASATFDVTNRLVEAKQSTFKINNVTMNRESNVNITDALENVTLNLHGIDETGNLSLTVSADTATPKAAIEDVVTSYNLAVSTLEAFVNVDLSDAEDPEAAALQGDSLITNILSKLRSLIGDVKSDYMDSSNASYTYNGNTGIADSLEDMGVWTSGKANQISVTDSTKLDYMLDNYFETSEQLFRGVFDVGTGGYENGVAEDLYDFVYSTSSSLTGEIAQHITNIEDQIDGYDDTIEDMYIDLDRYETRLWNQFAAMESAVASMQQELSWLTSQLGGPSG